MTPLLLCTDLDRTLLPNGSQPESPQARPLFAKLIAAKPGITLAYVTGRHEALIKQAIRDFGLPTPDFAIADVGATIYQVSGEVWRRWHAWDAQLAAGWGGANHAELHGLLRGIQALTLQEPPKQALFKLSYYAPRQTPVAELLAQVDAIFKAAGVQAHLIWSVDEATQQGLLDILPAHANKLRAIEFVMAAQGFDLDHTVFAGDSGNDIDVLLSCIPSVLVANADADIQARVASVAANKLYFAQGDFLGMNGNYGAGVLEGLAHYHPEIALWLRQPFDLH